MKYSLVSREVIADSIETVCNGQSMDGVLALGGCDKNRPGAMIAIARLNIPAIFVYGGTISRRVPVLCDLKPSGRYVATDLHQAGGVPQVMKLLLAHGLLHGDALTVTGQTLAEVLENVPEEPRDDQDVIRPWGRPMYPHGHLDILKGNLAIEGAVAKTSGVRVPRITGPARFLDSEEACVEAILAQKIKAGDVVVIRYEGSRSGPGIREMLSPTAVLVGAGLGDSVGLITDGRFSGGTTHGGRPCRAGSGGGRRDHPG